MPQAFDRFHVPEAMKEPGFKYRFVNTTERNVLDRKWRGWEVCEYPEDEKALGTTKPVTDSPSKITCVRGDLVLMRMPTDKWEETVGRERREARERQGETFNTMVMQANDAMVSKARALGLGRVPQQLIFRDQESADTQSAEFTA